MAPRNSCSTVQALRDIINTTPRGLILVPVERLTQNPATLHLDGNYFIPDPPPIEERLLQLGLRTTLVSQLAKAYVDVALRLRQTSERTLRRTLLAYQQIDAHPTISTIATISPPNTYAVHSAIVDLYLRTVRKMASGLFATCERHLSQSRCSTSGTIPRNMAIPRPWNTKVCGYIPAAAPVAAIRRAQQKSLSKSTATLDHDGVQNVDLIKFLGHSLDASFDSFARNNDCLPTYWAHSRADEDDKLCEGGVLSVGRTPHAYPVRYTHPKWISPPALPASSTDFFSNPRSAVQSSPRANQSDSILNMSMAFNSLRVDASQGGEKDEPSRECRENCDTDRSPISLFTVPVASKMRKRRMAPVPQRIAPCPRAGHSLSSSPPTSMLHPPPSPPSSSSHPLLEVPPSPRAVDKSTIPLPTQSPSGRPSNSSMSRRKVAPLPRRQPTSAPMPSVDRVTSHISISPPIISTLSTRPRRPQSPVSRTPSLISLNSYSDCSSPSDDGLDTPPPSPSIQLLDESSLLEHKPSVSTVMQSSPRSIRDALHNARTLPAFGFNQPSQTFRCEWAIKDEEC